MMASGEKGRKLGPGRKVAWIGIVLGIVYWIVESAMDTYLYDMGPYSERLFPSDLNEMEMRSLAVSVIIAFGIYAQWMVNRVERAETRLGRMNECFLSFGAEPVDNINRLTTLCGELLEASAALYSRLDEGNLCSWGQWQMPCDHIPENKPEGNICYDIIKGGGDEVVVLRDLLRTPYASSDSRVSTHGLKTYIGRTVRLGEANVGVLCAFYHKDYEPSEEDKRLMGIIASAIGVEEVRKRAESALRQSERQLRNLSSELLSAQETERKRIALQLHDSIGQSLSAIKFSIEETLEKLGDDAVMKEFRSLEAAVSIIRGVVAEVRGIQKNLRPSTLDDLGIIATITSFCRDFQAVYTNISIEREIRIQESDVPEPVKIVIFRVLQEAMNNVAKHSRAHLVLIRVTKVNGLLEFVVEDDGIGFEVKKKLSAGDPRGVGLSSMRERVELSKGHFSIESEPGSGVRVRAWWSTEEAGSTG